jgi:hypothetical protein
MLSFLFWSLLFSIAYTQPRLYYSNQHQYFLHGLATAGEGFLSRDWLANTADPAPTFSAVVAYTYYYGYSWFFYLYYTIILGAYLYALAGIFDALSDGKMSPRARLAFLTSILVLHCGLLRWGSAQTFGVDYPWYFQAGLANQYILGAGLQPSVFGVFLLLSVAAFLNRRLYLAATWAGLAGVMHSTYLLSAAFLTLSYLYLLLRERRRRDAAFFALWTLLVVSPVVAYNLATFAPSSREAFAEAQRLLAHLRIPHHTQIDRWLDGIAWMQFAWILAAMFLVRRNPLLIILSVCFSLSLALTLLQAATGNDTLALLFPWRTSSVLVPLATAIVLAQIVNRLAFCWTATSTIANVVIVVICVLGGASITYFGLGYRTNEQELKLLTYIRENKSEGDLYLLPVELPNLSSGKRGAASLNFTPPPQRNTQKQNISVDLQQFRLFTGAPIYIDFKSIPYKDVEVLEWHERLLWNHHLYEQTDWNDGRIKDELGRRGITHVVAAADRELRCDALECIYRDKYYLLYRVRRP